MRTIAKLGKVFDGIMNVFVAIAGILLVFVMIIVCVDVVMRYFFNSPIPWEVEVTTYTLLYVPFLAGAWVLRDDRHVKIDLLLDRLNKKGQYLLNLWTSLVCAVLFIFITWYGVRVVSELQAMNYLMNSEMSPPKFIITAIIPAGCILLVIQFLRRAYSNLNSWVNLRNKEGKPGSSHQSEVAGER